MPTKRNPNDLSASERREILREFDRVTKAGATRSRDYPEPARVRAARLIVRAHDNRAASYDMARYREREAFRSEVRSRLILAPDRLAARLLMIETRAAVARWAKAAR